MTYQVVIPRTARKHLDNLPMQVRRLVEAEVTALQDDPRPPGCVELEGYRDEYRIRIGDYRVRYRVDDSASAVVVIDVRHRKDIYRQ